MDSKISLKKNQRKTQNIVKQQKDAKHRWYVLNQWLKTELTYNQDIKASIKLIKPKMLQYNLIDESTANKLFPYFDQMLKISDEMIEVISIYKTQNINDIMIGEKLNKVVSFYKIYLEYFKHKTQIKTIYENLEKQSAKELRNIEIQLRNYFDEANKVIVLGKSKIALNKSSQHEDKQSNPKPIVTIHDCLERPLYRLFKYHLLIDSYLSKLSPKHPDFEPLKRTKQLFVQTGEKCNNSFTQQQSQDLKRKLQDLYGQNLPQTSQYKTMMSAETLYFPCKLYIFSNLVIISKAEKMIGFRQQKLYMKMGIDEFSFITYKKDMKYFKSKLMLCGVYDCLHFILPDKGTRLEIYQLIKKIIHEQRLKAFQRRQHKELKRANQLTFMVDEKETQAKQYLTGIKFQVVGIDLRELGMFSSDTVFIVSVCIPDYIDDEATFLKTSQIFGQYSPKSIQSFKETNSSNKLQKQERVSMTKEEHAMTSHIGPVKYKKLQTESQIMKSGSYSPLNQTIQIHLSTLIEIYKELRERFPEINFPDIDPISKDFNFYTESKKKTKSFEVRSFLIEQFFNFVFRHPSIMLNPLSIVSKIRIDQYMWDYVVERSFYLQNQKRDQDLKLGQTAGNKYDQNHCQLCKESVINSVSKFEKIRERMIKIQQKGAEKYCFNFYNLIRNNLLGRPHSEFDSVQRMLLYVQYLQGRLDLAFMYKKNLAKVFKEVNIMIPKILTLEQRTPNLPIFHTVLQMSFDHKTTVGMMVNSIARDTEVFNMFDYRLVLVFNQQERILDQDELVWDLVDRYELVCEEKRIGDNDLQFVGPRNSYREPSMIKTTMGMISRLKSLLPTISKNTSALYLRKMVYFPLYLQLESTRANFYRSQLLNAETLQKISKTITLIPQQIWGEVCGLYYCQLNYNELKSSRASISIDNPAIIKSCLDILPKENHYLTKAKTFITKMQTVINERKKFLNSLNTQTEENFLSSIHHKMLEIGYKYFKVNTCYTQVDAKHVPNQLVHDSGLVLTGNCFIGVNYNEFVVIRDKKSSIETVRLPLEEVDIVHSVYSIFLKYIGKPLNLLEENYTQSNDSKFQLRFDSKILFGFVQLCEKYKLLKNQFETLYSDYQIDV